MVPTSTKGSAILLALDSNSSVVFRLQLKYGHNKYSNGHKRLLIY